LAGWLLSLLLVAGLSGGLGFYLGARGELGASSPVPSLAKILNREPRAAPLPKEVDFSLFWKVWDILNQDYLFQPLDAQDLVYGAISGLVGAAGDPFTAFLPPQQNEVMSMHLNGRYEGVGAELAVRDGNLVIVSPLDGSPAKAAGALPGDLVLKIDDDSVTGMTLTEAVARIRGPAGETVTLTLRRGEGEPFSLAIVREEIALKSVSWRRLEDAPEVAYLRISRFGEPTVGEWSEAVAALGKEGGLPKGVILDLRGNPGGYLESSVSVASEFLDPGSLVVSEEFGDGSSRKLLSQGGGQLRNLPVVVLIDKGSASSSEILALALKDNLGAVLVGETSFGKGTVQEAKDFTDGSGLHVTAAKWLSPQGSWVHEKGITPDVEVLIDSEVEGGVQEEGGDPQLEKAVEVLRASIAS